MDFANGARMLGMLAGAPNAAGPSVSPPTARPPAMGIGGAGGGGAGGPGGAVSRIQNKLDKQRARCAQGDQSACISVQMLERQLAQAQADEQQAGGAELGTMGASSTSGGGGGGGGYDEETNKQKQRKRLEDAGALFYF